MSESGCASCRWRAKYDNLPGSLMGRLWRWHANFCPGWRAYMRSLPEEERHTLVKRYRFPPEKFA